MPGTKGGARHNWIRGSVFSKILTFFLRLNVKGIKKLTTKTLEHEVKSSAGVHVVVFLIFFLVLHESIGGLERA